MAVTFISRVKKRAIAHSGKFFIAAAMLVLASSVFHAWHTAAFSPMVVSIERAYEDVAYFLMPSADRAFAYGEKHFNAMRAGEYDVVRAEYFFEETRRLDPNHPLVYHELARISFLKGNYHTALYRINTQIEEHGAETPSSYYVRGLIEGFTEDYAASAKDYEKYLESDPTNWAAINDYAWVLLKSGRIREANTITTFGLKYFPENPWLLNSNAIANYELGNVTEALARGSLALAVVAQIGEQDWLKAYPGNDPRVANEGVSALQDSIIHNMHMMRIPKGVSKVQ